jgi:hypothetical protein
MEPEISMAATIGMFCMVIAGLSICLSMAFYIMWRDEKKHKDWAIQDAREDQNRWVEATQVNAKLERQIERLRKKKR